MLVDEGDVELRPTGQVDRLTALRGFGDIKRETRGSENLAHNAAHGRRIVNYQYAAWQPHTGRPGQKACGLLQIGWHAHQAIGLELCGRAGRAKEHRKRRLGRRARD